MGENIRIRCSNVGEIAGLGAVMWEKIAGLGAVMWEKSQDKVQ